jgi:phospholipid/cholesterol/gamma-HCH transport system permease protein
MNFLKKYVAVVQDYSLLCGRMLRGVLLRPHYPDEIIFQADTIGVGSLPVVLLTGFFTGAILTLQTSTTLAEFGATKETGQLVSLSMVTQLGPVLSGLMMSGRNSAGIASEIGSMIVTDQIDAMRALGSDPIKKLLAPRILATTGMLVFLTVIADAVGILGGAFIAATIQGQDGSQYFHSAYTVLHYSDVVQGLIKPLVFGFIISSCGCYYGMATQGGTQGVGRNTTRAVVTASTFIIVTNFLISRLMIGIFGR